MSEGASSSLYLTTFPVICLASHLLTCWLFKTLLWSGLQFFFMCRWKILTRLQYEDLEPGLSSGNCGMWPQPSGRGNEVDILRGLCGGSLKPKASRWASSMEKTSEGIWVRASGLHLDPLHTVRSLECMTWNLRNLLSCRKVDS